MEGPSKPPIGGYVLSYRVMSDDTFWAAQTLRGKFPTLEFRVQRSSKAIRSFIVGVRPKSSPHDLFVWIWTPMDGYPNDELMLKLHLIA